MPSLNSLAFAPPAVSGSPNVSAASQQQHVVPNGNSDSEITFRQLNDATTTRKETQEEEEKENRDLNAYGDLFNGQLGSDQNDDFDGGSGGQIETEIGKIVSYSLHDETEMVGATCSIPTTSSSTTTTTTAATTSFAVASTSYDPNMGAASTSFAKRSSPLHLETLQPPTKPSTSGPSRLFRNLTDNVQVTETEDEDGVSKRPSKWDASKQRSGKKKKVVPESEERERPQMADAFLATIASIHREDDQDKEAQFGKFLATRLRHAKEFNSDL